MSRNQNRVAAITETPPLEPAVSQGAPPASPHSQGTPSPFNFITPTEMVDIPSGGQFYPAGHPLHGVTSIEIKHLTAKEEDILTSVSLLKKGLALDRMLQSIIVDKKIKLDDLLIGDKNALLIASRIYGYGAHYEVEVTCESCESTYAQVFHLEELEPKKNVEVKAISPTEEGTFIMTLPQSQLEVEIKLLTSRDETKLSSNKSGGSLNLLKTITVSINGQTDPFYMNRALESLPIVDANLLKRAYLSVMPDIDMSQEVEGTECGHTAKLEVPLDAGFFWPQL